MKIQSKLRIFPCCLKLFFLIFEFSYFQLASLSLSLSLFLSLIHILIYLLFLAKYSLIDKFMLLEKTKCISCKLFAQLQLFSSGKAFTKLYNFTSCKKQQRNRGRKTEKEQERERSELKTRDFKN